MNATEPQPREPSSPISTTATLDAIFGALDEPLTEWEMEEEEMDVNILPATDSGKRMKKRRGK